MEYQPRKLIYIAGKYTGSSYEDVENNIQKAKNAEIEWLKKGYAVICPHMNTAHFEEYNVISYDEYIANDLEILGRCDCVYFLDNWKESKGAQIEFQFAREHGIEMAFE